MASFILSQTESVSDWCVGQPTNPIPIYDTPGRYLSGVGIPDGNRVITQLQQPEEQKALSNCLPLSWHLDFAYWIYEGVRPLDCAHRELFGLSIETQHPLRLRQRLRRNCRRYW